jgi:isoleucyl-tRNA synthetase
MENIIVAGPGKNVEIDVQRVNPDDIVERYGADTLRLYEMFLGPLEQSKHGIPMELLCTPLPEETLGSFL